jgi:hypothetical protein
MHDTPIQMTKINFLPVEAYDLFNKKKSDMIMKVTYL